jgi:hypothetical protein
LNSKTNPIQLEDITLNELILAVRENRKPIVE